MYWCGEWSQRPRLSVGAKYNSAHMERRRQQQHEERHPCSTHPPSLCIFLLPPRLQPPGTLNRAQCFRVSGSTGRHGFLVRCSTQELDNGHGRSQVLRYRVPRGAPPSSRTYRSSSRGREGNFQTAAKAQLLEVTYVPSVVVK